MVKKSNSRFGKSSFRKFMKSSQISPDFINNDLDLDYAPNYGKSLASHASHVVNTTPDVNESNESSSGDESYRSNTTLESDNDADTNDVDASDTQNFNLTTDINKTNELLNKLLHTNTENEENFEFNSELSYELYSYSDDENDDINCVISK